MRNRDLETTFTRRPFDAITHVHTRHSNDLASDLDPMIRKHIGQTLGSKTQFRWGECFTSVDKLAALLSTPRQNSAIGIITTTDHMNHRHHVLPDEILQVAAQEPRLAACAEIFCIDQDQDGLYRKAPEVLVYGDGHPVESRFGEYFGLAQSTLDEIFRVCRAKGSESVQTSRVLDYCVAHGVVWRRFEDPIYRTTIDHDTQAERTPD